MPARRFLALGFLFFTARVGENERESCFTTPSMSLAYVDSALDNLIRAIVMCRVMFDARSSYFLTLQKQTLGNAVQATGASLLAKHNSHAAVVTC